MSKIIDYQVWCRDSVEELESIVCEKIKEGWQPLGSVSVSVCQAFDDPYQCGDSYNYAFTQAMVKYPSESAVRVSTRGADGIQHFIG